MPTTAEIAAAAAVASVLAAPDYYAAIDAPRSASMAELRQCYVRTSLRVHPDKNQHPNATQAFQRVAAAWRELGDEQSRHYYDQRLSSCYDSDCISSSSFSHVEPDEAFASFARAAAACASTGGFNDSADAMFFAQMAQAQARNSYGMCGQNPYGQAPPEQSLQSVGSGVAYAAGLWTVGLATSCVGFVTLGNFMRRIAVIQGFGQVAIGGVTAYQNPEIRKTIDCKVMEISTSYKLVERTAPVKAALGNVGAKMRNKIEDIACSEIVVQLGSTLGAMPSCLPRSRLKGESPPSISVLEAGARATLAGLSAAGELNGRLCDVVRFEKQKERWVVRVLPVGVRVLPSGGSDSGHTRGCAAENMKLVRADNLRLEAPLSLENTPRTIMQFV